MALRVTKLQERANEALARHRYYHNQLVIWFDLYHAKMISYKAALRGRAYGHPSKISWAGATQHMVSETKFNLLLKLRRIFPKPTEPQFEIFRAAGSGFYYPKGNPWPAVVRHNRVDVVMVGRWHREIYDEMQRDPHPWTIWEMWHAQLMHTYDKFVEAKAQLTAQRKLLRIVKAKLRAHQTHHAGRPLSWT